MKRPSRPKRTRLRAASRSQQRTRPELSDADQSELEDVIGYKFKEARWLNTALTHPSLIDNYDGDAQFSNQRLEFLGDRVLGLVVAETLINRYPKQREGYLTKLFHNLVSGEACARVGETLNLRPYIFMDNSMQRNRPGHYDKAVADAIEALIAAIYRDGNFDAAESFIKKHWIFETEDTDGQDNRNPKTLLSDWCGANQKPYASYKTIGRSGPDHAPIFEVEVQIEGLKSASGSGNNRQNAEMEAAENLLKLLEADD